MKEILKELVNNYSPYTIVDRRKVYESQDVYSIAMVYAHQVIDKCVEIADVDGGECSKAGTNILALKLELEPEP